MTTVNNVIRLLESRKIVFEAFELPFEKLGAIETAQILQVPPEIVYKTIVVTREKKKPLLCVIPGPKEVNLKSVARFCGEKKVFLPTQKETEGITGLLAGGISPLALINKGFVTIIDKSVENLAAIHISGGQRGLSIKLKPEDLKLITNGQIANISDYISN